MAEVTHNRNDADNEDGQEAVDTIDFGAPKKKEEQAPEPPVDIYKFVFQLIFVKPCCGKRTGHAIIVMTISILLALSGILVGLAAK